ncbi:MAG: MBL fold metallo-hydrolase [Candidatus Nitricoxidivorans perseverans]|uniref:MBL fold metallo-hydrolase n=1 Tax=Candidatus Nitricoxidivorans perseverans TaxID=2975601 RepID=A0AA49IXI5_9PROT|nr:MAG: MBL fold metallo-hydrolase [Candidatus Nitricoxidivorans perseverans]
MTTLHFPHETPPPAGATPAVAPGVRWLRMPLPYALDHVNLWLLEDGDFWTAVDTGIALDEVRRAWESALAGRWLARQIVTHFHPDHLGLAAWLEARAGAPLWITEGEFLAACATIDGTGDRSVAAALDFFRRHGLDEARLSALEKRGNAYARGVPALPASWRKIADGEEISIGGRAWRVIVGHGHSPEHASLYCESLGVLIAGDMMLPRISTNISAFAGIPGGNPLADFLASITRLAELPGDTLVLPSHGLPFRGLRARAAQLEAHHRARCDDLLKVCAGQPRTAAELLPVLFARDISDPHQLLFAMGEAIAHLDYLEQAGAMARLEADGVIRFCSGMTPASAGVGLP